MKGLSIPIITSELPKDIATTTDNAFNFLKAFREFGVSFDWHFAEDKELYEEVEYIEIDTSLSFQVKCGSHTFSLVGVTDSAAALKNIQYFNQKASEKFVEILGTAIHRPVATHWNSVYDCVKKILRKDTAKLAELMNVLDISEFSPNDLLFLDEYVKVLKPIAYTID